MSDPLAVLAECERFVAGVKKVPALAAFIAEHEVAGELAPHVAAHVCRRVGFRPYDHGEPFVPYLREFSQWWRAQHPAQVASTPEKP
jgi:hypothetical protein